MSDWEWFGHAGHFIGAEECRFHLTTQVGSYLVSTVGDWRPSLGGKKRRHEIGFGRMFETMVFKAGKKCDSEECGCGLPEIDGSELAMEGYNTAQEAAAGHMRMCRRYDLDAVLERPGREEAP